MIHGNAQLNAPTVLDTFTPDGAFVNGGTVTVGEDDTGHDVKFFGATSGQHLLWDQSADELVLVGDTKLSFHDAAGGENIIATSDGHLEVNAGTTLDITAPTVDINVATLLNIDGHHNFRGRGIMLHFWLVGMTQVMMLRFMVTLLDNICYGMKVKMN